MIFKLKYNEKYTIYLNEFITKIIFISKHFNYNIHFLNIVSVRWCPLLLTHSSKFFWNFCITRCSVVGEIAVITSLVFCFQSTVVLGFFSYTLLFVHLALEISPEEKVLRLGTSIPMNIEVPTKSELSHNDRIFVFENRLHSVNPMLYRPALHGNCNALSIARRRLKDKFPTPTVPLTAVLTNRQVFLPDPVLHEML
jgi:hypothetical protein